jgi:2,3-bisphosphoglycerate-independent phosphoglycerate mutase
MNENKNKPVVLCIMDGWGIDKNSEYNAVTLAKTPNVNYLSTEYPYSTLEASGEHVGLPPSQVGNSEVGHMNLGSGRVVLQTLPKINKAFANNDINNNENFQKFLVKHNKNKIVHLLGLCSEGGVHSHSDHIIEMSKLLHKNNIKTVIHIFSDGRDSSPKQLGQLIKKFESSLPKDIQIATLIGRYYAMDRDNRWDRVKKSFDLIAYGKHKRKVANIFLAIKEAYENDETDEFISPTLIGDYKGIQEDDSLLMINFRADRVRELLTAFLDPDFSKFKRHILTPKFTNNLGMSEYSNEISKYMSSIFIKEKIKDTLGEIIAKANLKQLRLAETEKYPHVTYFFNGGNETVNKGETRIMIPSPKVSTYDLKPEMSAKEVENKLINAIQNEIYDLIIINFANPDMVGHTGDLKAAIKAVETIDNAVGKIKNALDKTNGIMLLTADHGNCEVMKDLETKLPHTSHTCNKVPLILISKDKLLKLQNGKLADIAPTILELMSLQKPETMNGSSLIVK